MALVKVLGPAWGIQHIAPSAGVDEPVANFIGSRLDLGQRVAFPPQSPGRGRVPPSFAAPTLAVGPAHPTTDHSSRPPRDRRPLETSRPSGEGASLTTKTPAETRKATGGRDVPEFIPAPPAKKRKRRDDMPRVWLRLELFELGLLPLPSKHAATLTVGNVKKALDALHSKLQAAGDDDAVMADVEASFVESDNLNSVTFPVWKEAVDAIFQWREQDYKAFWLLLVQFHRMIPVKNHVPVDAATPLDVDQCMEREEVPVFKMAIFLFIQTVKPHSWRAKYSLDSFNAVWYREHAESLATAAALESAGAVAAATAPKSPVLNSVGSPHMRGAASPPPPQSPHTVGMADRSTADSYYLAFVREKLEDLFGLLYPSVDLKDESQTVVSADQIDLLGFLLCLGDANLVDENVKLSSCYPKWELPDDGDAMAEADGAQEFVQRVENGAKVCRFYKTHLSLNEKMYPPVGFSVPSTGAQNNLSTPSPPAFSLNACKNCRIVTAPNTGILSMERCENVQLTSLSGLVRVSNCLDTRLNVYTLSPVIVSGENVGVILGPYNTKYSGLKQQLSTVPFVFNAESQGSWNLYLDLDSEKVAYRDLLRTGSSDITDTDKPPVSIQVPETFRDVCVPVKPAAGSGPAERPFPIPPEYVAAVRKQYETVESLRQLVTSDEFDLTKKRTMEVVIQLKFKEWLSSTSNVRQILDLVHLDRANGGCEPGSKES
uniref:Tubulin binding cofactor C-like domain-containing protein n=1 Tax=Phytophthora ramorum TaxID=164328 RepID=H3GXU0_PHYRM